VIIQRFRHGLDTYKALVSSQRTGMHALEYQMPLLVHVLDPLRSWRAPRKEHDAFGALLGHRVNHLLGQQLPAFARVRVRFSSADRQACVDHQHAAVGPWRQQTAPFRRLLELWVVLLEGYVDVLERRRSGGRGPDGKAEAVGLVRAVVRVLACDYGFDCVEGCVARPGA